MTRLIDADALARNILNEHCFPMLNSNYSERDLERSNNLSKIFNAPTIDAEPVRHGHWEFGSGFYPPTCSVCNLVPLTPGYVGDVNFYKRYFKRCPHCGAKMDEVTT